MPTLRRYVFQRLQHVATQFGVDMVQSTQMERLPQARYLRRLFTEFGVTGVIDVGANEGQYHDFIRREVGFSGPMVSIEPIPALAAAMRARSHSDPAWRVEEMAMGAAAGTLSFNVTAGSQFSSFLAPIASTEEMFFGQNVVAEAIPVTVERLSTVIAKHDALLGPRVYLKLDTQGFDLEALKGLDASTGRVVALQSETSVRPIYDDMPSYVDSIAFIQSMGYTLSQIFPNNEGHFPLLIEFDCHFVRLSAASKG